MHKRLSNQRDMAARNAVKLNDRVVTPQMYGHWDIGHPEHRDHFWNKNPQKQRVALRIRMVLHRLLTVDVVNVNSE